MIGMKWGGGREGAAVNYRVIFGIARIAETAN
jgi:hypothetical protein